MSLQKWEYCQLAFDHSDGPTTLIEIHFHPEGDRRYEHQSSADVFPHELRRRICARFGRDGWEMVTIDDNVMYFKRPLVEAP